MIQNKIDLKIAVVYNKKRKGEMKWQKNGYAYHRRSYSCDDFLCL